MSTRLLQMLMVLATFTFSQVITVERDTLITTGYDTIQVTNQTITAQLDTVLTTDELKITKDTLTIMIDTLTDGILTSSTTQTVYLNDTTTLWTKVETTPASSGGSSCDGITVWSAGESWTNYTIGSQRTHKSHLWIFSGSHPAYGAYEPGSGTSNALGAWTDQGVCASIDSSSVVVTTYAVRVDTVTTIDTLSAAHTDSTITTTLREITAKDTIVATDSLANGISYYHFVDTLGSSVDTVVLSINSSIKTFVPLNKLDTITQHLVDTVIVVKLEASYLPNKDTVVTTTDSLFITDTTVLTIKDLTIDVAFRDTIILGTSVDTLLPALLDTVVLVRSDTLVYQPTITLDTSTSLSSVSIDTSLVDSVVLASKDTVVTTITLHITRNYSILKTDTLWDSVYHSTNYDTTLLLSDTTARDTVIDTLLYTPVITMNVDTLHTTDTVQFYHVDSVVMGNLDTLVTTAIYGDITDSMIQKTDTLYDGVVVATLYDTLPVLRDTVVLNIQYDTLRYTSALIPRPTTKEPVAIYPNPVRVGSGDVIIGLPQEQSYRVRIFDPVGNVMVDREGLCSEKSVRVAPDNFTSGQYLVILETTTASGRPVVRRGMLGVQR